MCGCMSGRRPNALVPSPSRSSPTSISPQAARTGRSLCLIGRVQLSSLQQGCKCFGKARCGPLLIRVRQMGAAAAPRRGSAPHPRVYRELGRILARPELSRGAVRGADIAYCCTATATRTQPAPAVGISKFRIPTFVSITGKSRSIATVRPCLINETWSALHGFADG